MIESDERFRRCDALVREVMGDDCRIVSIQSVHGGCVSEAFCLTLADGQMLFAKLGTGPSNCFEQEVVGLKTLRATKTIRIPEVVAMETAPCALLILQWIEAAEATSDFWSNFGQALAQLHRSNTTVLQFGFTANNLIGSTHQSNQWSPFWPDFFRDQRLTFQVRLAFSNGLISKEERQLIERLYPKLPELLAAEQVFPAVLHGDLWSGNILCDSSQKPVLFDPAAFYGHSEYEFAMTKLFGGFASGFYEAYHEVLPADDATRTRIEIYQVYHLLNHVNLFGRSYWPAIEAIAKKYTART